MKDNKFLTGFLIVTLLGAGALGFLLFQAKGKHSVAMEEYTTKVGELQSLQGGKPYPNESNYKKVLELQKTHQEAINNLQKQLAAAEIKVEPLTPEKFQDNLRETIKRVRALAAQKGTEIKTGDKFSLGFEAYESQPPKPDAAPPLGRMLKSIELAVTELLNTAPSEITKDIKRTPLPEEGLPGQKVLATPAPKPGAAGAKKTAEEQPLVKRYPFEIEFVAHEPKVRSFLNKIVNEKKQFFVLSAVKIENQVLTGPSKAAANAATTAPAPAENPAPAAPAPAPGGDQAAAQPAPAAAPAPADGIKFILGEEKVAVVATIEVVDFAEPPAEKAPAKPATPASAK